jgi:hypothetical protein
MLTNKKIFDNIKKWKIEFDSNGFEKDENWLKNAEKTEDILQLSHIYQKGTLIDVGFYNGNYKVYLISENDWENPKEIFESEKADLISEKVYEWIEKYAKE